MKFIIRRVVFASLFFFLGISVFSLGKDKIIGSITLSGLIRTNESVIYKILAVEEGDNFSSFDEEDFKQEILKTGILVPGEISYIEQDDYIDINIDIEEKWTLLPLPIVSISGEEQSYGFILIEQNFLGLRKLLFVNAGYSTLNGLTGGIMYRDIDLLPKDLSLIIGGFFTNNSDDSSVHLLGNLGVEKKINRLSLFSMFKYDYFLSENSKQSQFIGNSISIAYNDLFYTSTMQTGTKLFLSVTPGLNFENFSVFANINSSISHNREMSENLYLGGSLSSQHLDSPSLLEKFWGGSDNARTLEPILCDQYIGGSILLEYVFSDFGWGVVSSLVQYELGGYQHNDDKWNLYSGPGAGLRLYLKKIAIPAVGLDIAYNVLSNEFLFSIAMGMSR